MPAKPLLTAALKAKHQAEAEHGDHLKNVNQPKTRYEDDNMSIDSECLFEMQDVGLPAKPLLAAALRARENSMYESFSVQGVHLNSLNQPLVVSEEKSMDEDDLFVEEMSDAPANPLLRAAILAREQSKQEQYSVQAKHLNSLNQPKSILTEEKSIDEDELFNDPLELPPPKPLIAAAYKAREEQRSRLRQAGGNGSNTSHLQYINQPLVTNDEEDSASLAASEIFDQPSTQSCKPLLSAAHLAKRQQEAINIPGHLRDLSQPAPGKFDDDSGSLDMRDIFDEPTREPPPKKPLLAAALRAKEASESLLKAPRRRPSAMTAELVRKNSLDKSRSATAMKTRMAGKTSGTSEKTTGKSTEKDSHSPRKKASSRSSKSKSSYSKSEKQDSPQRTGSGFFSRRKKNG
jgi:hypothetical protein